MQYQVWNDLTKTQRAKLLSRPVQGNVAAITEQVAAIIARVQEFGDNAVLDYTRDFDGVTLAKLRYSEAQIAAQAESIEPHVKAAIDSAYQNIYAFHQAQIPQNIQLETTPGIRCEQRYHPLDAVGLYIPGGTAVLPSTALMLGIPAQIANNQRRVLVSPPDASGELSPALMYVAQKCQIHEVYRCGGAQAIAALALGTESIAPVNKIFGPGNAYVTAAKQAVAQQLNGPAIDMPAGPSELLVIADDSARASFVAADLLSQAEHGIDSQVILISTSMTLLTEVITELEAQLTQLPRTAIAQQALSKSALILVSDIAQAVALSQSYAPEHLSLQIEQAAQWVEQCTNAGSIFLGHFTPEAGGDYATGTNHVLPTYGNARSYSSLGLVDFYRRYTVQDASAAGLATIANAITTLAETEGLAAHANAVRIRLESAQ